MYGIKCRKVGGFFTVEAAVIVPLTIFLFCFLFYLTFYLYNRCVVSQDAYLLAFRGSLHCHLYPEEIEQYVLEQSELKMGRKYIALNGLISAVEADAEKVTVKATGGMKTSFTGQFLHQQYWNLSIEREAGKMCPAEFIRTARLMKKIHDGQINSKEK